MMLSSRVGASVKLSSASIKAAFGVRRRCFASVDVDHYVSGWNVEDVSKPGRYRIQTYNKISEKGLETFPRDYYDVNRADDSSAPAHALVVESHQLQESQVDVTVRAIARCGTGTNNIPVARMTELGIPVFNTPGANANAVKELILCGLLLGSRGIINGINHMTSLAQDGLAKERVEKDKAMFAGCEVKGKTLAVIGLGHIGASTARDASRLGMKTIGYDPGLSLDSALKLPFSTQVVDSIVAAVTQADYISLNIPYSEETTRGIIGQDVISHFKPGAVLLNFARPELVDSEALLKHLDNNGGKYIADFPDDLLWNHENSILLPHLGGSTEEAEDCAAAMAAETIRDYLETGTIRNSVNFPNASLPERAKDTIRISVVNKNVPGMLARITEAFAKANLNIVQQINVSRGDVAYNVLDIDHPSDTDLSKLQRQVTMLEGVLSSRVLFGTPGAGYARNIDGKFYV